MQIKTIGEENKITFIINISKFLEKDSRKNIEKKLAGTFTIYTNGIYHLLRFKLGLVHNCWFATVDDGFMVTFTTLDIHKEIIKKEINKHLLHMQSF